MPFSSFLYVPWRSKEPVGHTTLICVSEIRPENQLRLVVYTTIYKVLYIPGGWPWDFRTINCSELSKC